MSLTIQKENYIPVLLISRRLLIQKWHDGLYYKLLQYNIGGKFYDLIKNLYSKSKCSIKINDKRTEFFSYQKGVRQGCILSPILFNLYLNDVPFILDRDDTDPIILPNGTRLNSLLYADDLVLISKSAHGLQKALSIVAKFCNEWLLSINPKKTKVMIFQKKCRKSCYVLEEPRDVREQDISEKSSRVRYKARNKSVTTSSYPSNYCLFILVIHCYN